MSEVICSLLLSNRWRICKHSFEIYLSIQFVETQKMTEPFNSNVPEPRKVGVWTEGTHIEAKEFVIPKKSPESIDDIPTIPDLDDLQDILEKEISMPPVNDQKDAETVNTLAEVGGGISGSSEGVEAVLEVLMSHVPQVESDSADTVWTVDNLLSQLAEENT